MLLALWEIAELTKGRLLSGNTSRAAAWTAGLDSGDSLSWKSSKQGFSCLASGPLAGRVWGQSRVGSESGQSARSLEPGKWQGCLEVISSHLYSCYRVQPQQMVSCRPRIRTEGPSAGMRIYQLLLAEPPEAAASSLWKLHGQRGMGLRVCREPAFPPGGELGGRRAGSWCGPLLDSHWGEGAGVSAVWLGVIEEGSDQSRPAGCCSEAGGSDAVLLDLLEQETRGRLAVSREGTVLIAMWS